MSLSVAVTYQCAEPPIAESLIHAILDAAARVFAGIDAEDISWRLGRMPDLTVFSAWDAEAIRGFKLGYVVTSSRYYSWLGGVDPEYRGAGIATALMRQQHDWVFARGYTVIETEVLQENHAMQQLNERSGFRVAGMRFDKAEPRIIYRMRRPE